MATNPASHLDQCDAISDKTLPTSLKRAKANLAETKKWIGGEGALLFLSTAFAIWKSSGIWHGIGLGVAALFLIALATSIGDLYTDRQRIMTLENDLAVNELEKELSTMGGDETLKSAERKANRVALDTVSQLLVDIEGSQAEFL